MSRTFKKVDDDRVLDLTVRLGGCLPPNHLARFVVDSVYYLGIRSGTTRKLIHPFRERERTETWPPSRNRLVMKELFALPLRLCPAPHMLGSGCLSPPSWDQAWLLSMAPSSMSHCRSSRETSTPRPLMSSGLWKPMRFSWPRSFSWEDPWVITLGGGASLPLASRSSSLPPSGVASRPRCCP